MDMSSGSHTRKWNGSTSTMKDPPKNCWCSFEAVPQFNCHTLDNGVIAIFAKHNTNAICTRASKISKDWTTTNNLLKGSIGLRLHPLKDTRQLIYHYSLEAKNEDIIVKVAPVSHSALTATSPITTHTVLIITPAVLMSAFLAEDITAAFGG
ncbi:hypothetical protein ACROYT_G015916 [Oculina patagonica]